MNCGKVSDRRWCPSCGWYNPQPWYIFAVLALCLLPANVAAQTAYLRVEVPDPHAVVTIDGVRRGGDGYDIRWYEVELRADKVFKVTVGSHTSDVTLQPGKTTQLEVSRRATPFAPSTADAEVGVSVEALAEVNAARAARGLRPYIYDEGLTAAAKGAAKYRAERLVEGHTSNDFAFLPAATHAEAAGCAAWQPSWGFGSCCMFENWTYCGAAYCYGRDGRRYMHVFVR